MGQPSLDSDAEHPMPEGPEIRRAADQLARALTGHPVTDIFFRFARLRPLSPYLIGEVVADVDTRGKAMLLRFANGLVIFTHSQLYGRWYVEQSGSRPDTTRELRLAIHNAAYSALLYSASEIEVLDDAGLEDHPFLSRLGPDVLSEEVTPGELSQRLRDSRFARRRLEALLLDQGFAAGLGNYLRSEVLHAAGVHPVRRPVDCSSAEIERLASAICALPRQSYRTGGVTNDPERAATLRAAGVSGADARFLVFRRAEQQCYTCGEKIIELDGGGRRLYVCPRCQPGL
jgi:endonuclease-8